MSDYPLIVLTLHEFGLITDEQAENALGSYDREGEQIKRRAEAFRVEWVKRTPWWKRAWDPTGWRIEFWRSEREL